METIVYKKVGACEIALDVYPAAIPGAPVVMWIHGGALIMGTRTRMQPVLTAALVAAGVAQVSIDYRLAPETKAPGIFDDVLDALAWVRGVGASRFGWDSDRVGVVGHSAGGYLTLMVGAHARPRPRALVSFYGYGDVGGDWYARPDPFYCQQPMVSESVARAAVGTAPLTSGSTERHPYYLRCRQRGTWPREVIGFDAAVDPKAFERYCPERLVDAGYPPTLLLHGTADTDVPYQQSVQMAAALKGAGVDYEFITIPDGPHGFDRAVEPTDPETIPAAAAVTRSANFLIDRVSLGH